MARRAPARAATRQLTHIDGSGRLRMVDVGDKPVTVREAVAQGAITVSAAAQRLVRSGQLRGIKIGGRGQWRVEESELERFIAERYQETERYIADHPFSDQLADELSVDEHS